MNATEHAGHHSSHQAAAAAPGGLNSSENGYTLSLQTAQLPAGESELRFQILGPDGGPITGYTPIHDRKLHLIVVRRDLTGFWHVHPEESDGGWSVRLSLPEAGAYRLFADFSPTELGQTLTLGANVAVGDGETPRAVPEPATTFAVDGYEVSVAGELAAGEPRPIELSVSRAGRPVTDLQPYLAAYGHLVVLRAGDLAYVHVHPDGSPDDGVTEPGPGIGFHAQVPGPGTYRLFLDFKHEDTVRTAEFTAVVR